MIPHVNDTKNEFEDVDLQYAKEQSKHIKWYHYVLLNRTLKVALSLIIVAIATPLLIYQFVFYAARRHSTTDGFSFGSCLVPTASRLPCGLGNVSASDCHTQCCYDSANDYCFHRFPSRFSYIMDRHWAEDIFLSPRVSTVPFKSLNSLTNIRLSLDEVSPTHLSVTFYNSANLSYTGRRIEDKEYNYEISSPELNVVVNTTKGTIFNTVNGPLIAAENIWEMAFKLTDETLYGFGDIPIKGETVKVLYNHKDGITSIPLIYAKSNGTFHGLLIDTADPTEVLFREDNVIVVRSITNFGLKFHVFVGPKPVDVMNDVMNLISLKEDLQYWMMGAHVCSEYTEIPKSTAELNNFIQEAATQNLPFESHCVTPIVFDDACDTEPAVIIDEGAVLLHNAGKRFIPHVSPYILYELNETIIGNEIQRASCNSTVDVYKDLMIQNSEGIEPYVGVVGNSNVVYPNYKNITDDIMEKLWIFTTNVDGVVLENSWPLDEADNFVNETKYYLPYFSEHFEKAFNQTPQWNASDGNGKKHLHTHNEYSNHFAIAFDKVKSVPTWLSSHFMNGNVYVNRQNIVTSWSSLQKELVEAALGGISGLRFWSTPICGDTENFDSEIHSSLCVKWYMAATYLPMIRIHSKGTPRDPLSFKGTHRSLMISALQSRLSLAPYLFTTLQSGPLLRPMFYQYPDSESLKDLTSQFSVGDDLMIVPNLQPNQAMVHMWMPPGVWYEMWSGLKIDGEEGDPVTMATTEADFFTAIRGGSIVVLQKDVKLNAEETRAQSKISLTIALECLSKIESDPTQCNSSGALYVTQDMVVNFQANDVELKITATGDMDLICDDTETIMAVTIGEINIYGLNNSLNNYDQHRYVETEIDLCELRTESELLFDFTREI